MIALMRSTRHEPLLLHNTMRIAAGHLDEFRAAVAAAVVFVEQHGPQVMVQVFVDEPRLLAHSFQLYPDSDAILRHWELSDPYIRDVMAHCSVERLVMYGEPDERVTRRLPPVRTGGVERSTVPRHIGFLRAQGGTDATGAAS
jgi:hypothetical protein